jgi:hypothetical protein
MMIAITLNVILQCFIRLVVTMMRVIMSKVVIFSVILLKVNLLSTLMTNVVYAREYH